MTLSAIPLGRLLPPHFTDKETETLRREITSKGHIADAAVLYLRLHLALLPPDPDACLVHASGLGHLSESPLKDSFLENLLMKWVEVSFISK